MKKAYFILFLVVLNITMSCTPQSLSDQTNVPQACCDEDGEILPQLPPPGGGD